MKGTINLRIDCRTSSQLMTKMLAELLDGARVFVLFFTCPKDFRWANWLEWGIWWTLWNRVWVLDIRAWSSMQGRAGWTTPSAWVHEGRQRRLCLAVTWAPRSRVDRGCRYAWSGGRRWLVAGCLLDLGNGRGRTSGWHRRYLAIFKKSQNMVMF